jgi:hypothetical protein
MRTSVFAIAAIGLASIIGMSSAGAGGYPETTGPLDISPSSAAPGGTVEVSGGGFAPGATVEIVISSGQMTLRFVTTDGSGSFLTTVTIPGSMGPGAQTLSAIGESATGGTLTLSGSITVTGGEPLSGLAFTGANIAAIAGVALAVLAVGILFVGVTRRRSMAKV